MHGLNRYFLASIVFILAISIAFNVIQFRKSIRYERMSPVTSSDQFFIDSTIDMYSKEKNVASTDLMRTRFPVAIHINDNVCIALKNMKYVLGRSLGACYDADTKKLINKFIS